MVEQSGTIHLSLRFRAVGYRPGWATVEGSEEPEWKRGDERQDSEADYDVGGIKYLDADSKTAAVPN